MYNISEPEVSQNNVFVNLPIFELAFRPFFILATLSSVISMSLWLLILNGYVQLNHNGLNNMVWHTHEMLFAFAATVAVGFILTAAKTWTGQASLSGNGLLLLITIWIAARIAFYINSEISILTAIGLQTLWWLISIYTFSRMVIKSANKRNYLFIPLLSIMMVINISLLLLAVDNQILLTLHLAKSTVFMFIILMTIIGGRVIPFFTVRGANTQPIQTPKWLETSTISLTIIATVIFILSYFINLPFNMAFILIPTGIIHLVRLSFWKPSSTFKIPLLWSLHLSYVVIGIGMLLLGMSYVHSAIQFSAALHLITVAAIGLMIFAMMSRVSLGHTGRPLILKNAMSWAFSLILLSGLIRCILPLFNKTIISWNLSALLWLVAAGIFLLIYTPILMSKRADR